jgi:ABC-type transport system involved in multi-copper enzyme maturation permease subunit
VLWRIFVAQFFASESATSDHHVRQAMIGVIAFLMAPAFLLPMSLSGPFDFAATRFPAMLDPMIRLAATIYITYAVVSIGVIAAFTSDALGFDRRDAMVLGPLPVSGATIIAAKLGALTVLLLGAASLLTLVLGGPFALIASGRNGPVAIVRHFGAHVVATMAAAAFVFCVLVTVRALLATIARGRVVIASFFQFALVSAVLCFVVLVPTAIDAGPRRTPTLQPIPVWSPTNWFLGLHETLRGSDVARFWPQALTGLELTLVAIVAAILATIVSYRRQMQLALTPSASAGSNRAARLHCAFARAVAGRELAARATSDFVLTTLLRNRAQQSLIGMNADISVALVAMGLAIAGGDLATLKSPRTAVLWIPMLLGFWMTVGVRASFFVPSELPASWAFRSNARSTARAYWAGTRAAMIAFIIPPVLLVAGGVTMPLLGSRVAAWHVAFVGLMQLALIELVTLTIDFIPFTQPYRPGHGKLKSRWPVYVFGMFAFAKWSIRPELEALVTGTEMSLLANVAAAALLLHIAARWRGAKWSVQPAKELTDDVGDIAVLDIGSVVHHAHIGG